MARWGTWFAVEFTIMPLRRAIRPKSNNKLGLAMPAPITAPSVITHVRASAGKMRKGSVGIELLTLIGDSLMLGDRKGATLNIAFLVEPVGQLSKLGGQIGSDCRC